MAPGLWDKGCGSCGGLQVEKSGGKEPRQFRDLLSSYALNEHKKTLLSFVFCSNIHFVGANNQQGKPRIFQSAFMKPTIAKIYVLIKPFGNTLILEHISPDETPEDLIRFLLKKLELLGKPRQWKLTYLGQTLPFDERIGLGIPAGNKTVQLELDRQGYESELKDDFRPDFYFGDAYETDSDELEEDSGPEGQVDTDPDSSDFDILLDDSDLAVEDDSGSQFVPLDEDDAEDAATTVNGEQAFALDDDFGGLTEDTESIEGGDEVGGEVLFKMVVKGENSGLLKDPTHRRANREDHGSTPVLGDSDNHPGDSVVDEEEVTPVVSAWKQEAGRPNKPKKKAAQSVTRRATVRHYTRMNPTRLYPLLIVISKEMVARVKKTNTGQRSSEPFRVSEDSQVEIEPILPGVDCYPPKMFAKLEEDVQAAFRVVPRLVGQVEGAKVAIRQGQTILAEIPLKMEVVHRFWVGFFGLLTLLLPCVSAGFKHFGLDFQASSFSVFLFVSQFLFNVLTPLGLALLLCVITGVFWWWTRPNSTDVFWKVRKLSQGEELKRIVEKIETNPIFAEKKLLQFLNTFPDYQPGRLVFAEWHYRSNNFKKALMEYDKALRLGVAKGRHYHNASLAASKLKKNKVALRILQYAEKVLDRMARP